MLKLLVLYGSYRRGRLGIRLANYLVRELAALGHASELVDAREIGLPLLDRMYKEFAPGEAPPAMERLARSMEEADGFVFVAGEYNWGIQPGLKNLTDHYLEEWFGRPAAIASYSAGRLAGVRAGTAWHGTLSEMGLVVVSSTLAVGPIQETLDAEGQPIGAGGEALDDRFPRFAADLAWWAKAARSRRAIVPRPF